MVQQDVLSKIKSGRLRVHIVWTKVLAGDSVNSAREAVRLAPDKRVSHYWDSDQSLGRAYGLVLKLPKMRKLAWDVYLVFNDGTEWKETLPQPGYWMHQLGKDERVLDGAKLKTAVEKLLKKSR